MTSSVKIYTVGARKSEEGKKYGALAKGSAFFSGIPKFGPLVEVAREGLLGNYSLSYGAQLAYAIRVIGSHNDLQLCGMLRKGVPEKAQIAFAEQIRTGFIAGLRDLRQISEAAKEDAGFGLWNEHGIPLVRRLVATRDLVCDALLGGTLHSETAQDLFSPLFVHNRVLDTLPKTAADLSGQIKRILESEHPSQNLKGKIIDSVLTSACGQCKEMIGLPPETKDSEYHR